MDWFIQVSELHQDLVFKKKSGRLMKVGNNCVLCIMWSFVASQVPQWDIINHCGDCFGWIFNVKYPKDSLRVCKDIKDPSWMQGCVHFVAMPNSFHKFAASFIWFWLGFFKHFRSRLIGDHLKILDPISDRASIYHQDLMGLN